MELYHWRCSKNIGYESGSRLNPIRPINFGLRPSPNRKINHSKPSSTASPPCHANVFHSHQSYMVRRREWSEDKPNPTKRPTNLSSEWFCCVIARQFPPSYLPLFAPTMGNSSKDDSATSGDASAGDVQPSNSSLYSEGERVLAYHGPRIYEAKASLSLLPLRFLFLILIFVNFFFECSVCCLDLRFIFSFCRFLVWNLPIPVTVGKRGLCCRSLLGNSSALGFFPC